MQFSDVNPSWSDWPFSIVQPPTLGTAGEQCHNGAYRPFLRIRREAFDTDNIEGRREHGMRADQYAAFPEAEVRDSRLNKYGRRR